VVVLWSAEAVKSQWVRAEADMAREAGTLVQLSLDGTTPPMPFNRIQCADLAGWTGDPAAPGWRKVASSVAELVGAQPAGGSLDPPLGAVAPPASAKPSIAVMPFSNLSGDPEQAYFADGMMEEIVSALARFKTISVAASGATAAFRGAQASPQDVGRRLGVRYVLEGNVRRASARVRIAVKLVDAADGAQIWGDRFEDALDDVFALQDKVALAVAGIVLPAIRGSEARRLSRRPTDNMSSYDLYLRAWSSYRSVSEAGVLQALELLDRALELDPAFDQALGLAAASCGLIRISGWTDDAEAVSRRCGEFVDRALRAGGDDEVVLGNVALGLAYGLRRIDRALPLIRRAIAQNPGYAVNWLNGAVILMMHGDLEPALEHLETAERLDPLSIVDSTRIITAQIRCLQGRFEEALALLRQSSLSTWTYHLWLAIALARMGKNAEARGELAKSREIAPLGIPRTAESLASPDHQRLFLENCALVEGEATADGA
jgi:adenylate cyclase